MKFIQIPTLYVDAGKRTKMTDNRPMQAGQIAHLDSDAPLYRFDAVIVPDTSKYTLGCDISHWNTTEGTHIDFKKMAAHENADGKKVKFVVIKFTDGCNLKWIDPDSEYNWKASADQGLLRAAYPFFTMDTNPRDQAKHFYDEVWKLDETIGELQPWLDYEIKNGTATAVLDFLNYLLEFDPVIYTSLNYWFNPPPEWTQYYDLAVAHWGAQSPAIPPGWSAKGWKFWQWSATGDGASYGATSNYIDLDWFNGTEAELRAYAGLEAEPEVPEEPEQESITWYEWAKRITEATKELAGFCDLPREIPDPPVSDIPDNDTQPDLPTTDDTLELVWGSYVRATPAGAMVGSIAKDARVQILETKFAMYNGLNYEWGRIEKPMAGWIAISHGLTRKG